MKPLLLISPNENEELLYTLALTRIPGLGLIGARRLLLAIGDQLTDLFKASA